MRGVCVCVCVYVCICMCVYVCVYVFMIVCLIFSCHIFEFNSYVNVKPCDDTDNPSGLRIVADVAAPPSPVEMVT